MASVGELMSCEAQEAEDRLVAAFSEARERTPALLLIDDIDLLGVARGVSGSLADSRLLAALLVQLEAPCSGLIVLAMTSRPEAIDAALRRPGRFDAEIEAGSAPCHHACRPDA